MFTIVFDNLILSPGQVIKDPVDSKITYKAYPTGPQSKITNLIIKTNPAGASEQTLAERFQKFAGTYEP